jgi:replicative DNA helicase
MLYSENSALMVLGHLLNKPTLLLNDKYKLEGTDFNEFHRIIFWAVKNITAQGAKEIDEIAVDMFLQCDDARYEYAKKYDFMGFIKSSKELATVDDFDYHYNVVKKYALLRFYKNEGLNIREFYNEDIDNRDTLEGYEMEDIVLYFDKIQAKAKRKYLVNTDIEEIKAGYKMEEIVEQFTETPMFGATTPSLFLNSATRGLLKGQLNILSMKSGTGKSTWALYNSALIGCPYLYDIEQGNFVKNPTYTGEGVLYMDYEMNQLYETSPKLLGSISKVPTTHILNGTYDYGERERVNKAIEILHDSNIYMVNMPNFTLSAIDAYIQDYVLNHNVGYVFFDYISEQASVNSEVAYKNKVTTRGDMVLATMSSTLKDIAVKYNVSVSTYTQTNANANTQEILDASCIAGSRAVQNKTDIGGIMMPLRPNEVEIANDIIESLKHKGHKIINYPNRILHLYKVRFSSYEQGIKIWLNLDLSTGATTDCWVTTKDNEPYDLKGAELIHEK